MLTLRRPAITFGCIVLLSLISGPPFGSAAETTFHVAATEEATEVRFRSKATLETFEGRTHEVSGYFALDLEDLTTLEGEVVCDLAGLDTGIGLRNKHMRDNVLHTEDHPTATFEIEECSGGVLAVGVPTSATVKGRMTLHGVTRPLEATVVATLESDHAMTIQATFEVTLADFEIPRPKMLIMKVAETVELTLTSRATTGPAPKRTR